MTDLLKIAENLAAAGLDHPAVDDAVIKLTNAAGHPARGVVDEDAVNRALDAWFGGRSLRPHYEDHIDAMRAALQAAQPADHSEDDLNMVPQPAVPPVPDAILRAFSDAAVDAAWTGTGIVRLTAADGEITAECVPPSSVTFAATPKDQPAQGVG